MTFTRRHFLRFSSAAIAMPALPVRAQEWPSRPIRMIIGTASGVGADVVGRYLGNKLASRLGQSIVAENITQGVGALAYQALSKAPPDGHTIGILAASLSSQAALRKSSLPYDPLNGFTFITTLCGYPLIYAVSPQSPIGSFKELISLAKAEPQKITYTIHSPGSINHLMTKWVELVSGAAMTPVSYRSFALAASDVNEGHVNIMVDALPSVIQRVHDGQLRMLAVSSPERYALFPEVPTISEMFPGVEFMSWLALAMPPGTPRPITDRMNKEIDETLHLPDVKMHLAELGNIPMPSSPEETQLKIESEIVRWTHVVEAGGITEK